MRASAAEIRPGGFEELKHWELECLELFRSVEPGDLPGFVRDCEVRILEAGEVLIESGEHNRRLYLLLSGRLSVRLESATGRVLAVLHAGESVGEMSLIDHKPASAFVVADTLSRVLVVDEDLMWMLVETSHAVSNNLLYTLVRRLRDGNNVIRGEQEQVRRYQMRATVDATTDLYNRFWLKRMLPRQIGIAQTQQAPFSCLMIDIDHFKRINDEHGHLLGDRVLRAVADRLRDGLRSADMAVRFGGDEFLVLLPDTTRAVAAEIAERLREGIAELAIQAPHGGKPMRVTVSIGVADLHGHGDMETLLAECDAALYRAKASARNCVAV
jgi:diguanylate cyclase (GGDEF)-like protein